MQARTKRMRETFVVEIPRKPLGKYGTTLTSDSQRGTILIGYLLPGTAVASLLCVKEQERRDMNDWSVRPFAGQHIAEDTLGEHLMFLPDTDWAIWRWSGLRGTGFPISQVLQFAMPTCAAAADLFLAGEAEAEEIRERICALLSDEVQNTTGGRKSELIKFRHRVKHTAKLSPPPPALSSEIQMHLDALQVAYTRNRQFYTQLQARFLRATEQTMEALHKTARDERFREAVMWQNRGAIRGSIASFLNKPA